MKMEKLSVVVITYNEEKNIGRCLRSVKAIADEIIVLDSFSTDNTVAIARQSGAKVWQQPFRGYVEQKNEATRLASYNYIMSIDADEEIDETLQSAISDIKQTFTFGAYRMKRCTNFCGYFIRNGAWYPDRKVRLFDKRIAKWGGLNPHDKVVFNKPVAIKQLPGEILHYSFATADEQAVQNDRFSSIVADSYFKAGKRTSFLRKLVNPCWAFVYGFIIRMGFLDGKKGLIIALNQARYTFLKHKKLLLLQQQKSVNNSSDIQTSANADRLTSDIRTHVACEE
jgi:glycosyltransferase involved in cell wall biosynthesis